MSDWYNLTYLDNTSGLLGASQGVNDASNGWLGGLILLVFALLFFVVFYQDDFKRLFLADAFLTAVLAGALWAAGLLEFWAVGVAAVPAAVAVILVVWPEN